MRQSRIPAAIGALVLGAMTVACAYLPDGMVISLDATGGHAHDAM